jgi:hypothetical protein
VRYALGQWMALSEANRVSLATRNEIAMHLKKIDERFLSIRKNAYHREGGV